MADQRTTEFHESFVDVGPLLVADAEPSELVQPTSGAFHRPAGLAQAALVVDPPLRQDRLDAEFPQPLAVRLGVVGQIALHGVGLLPGVPDLARDRRDGVEQRSQLGNVVDVGRLS